jgi:hypothetical protein
MQVLLEHDLLHDVNKTGKIGETSSMARIYKAAFKSVNAFVDKHNMTQSMNEFLHITTQATKRMTHFVKSSSVVSDQHEKHKKLYVKQHMP